MSEPTDIPRTHKAFIRRPSAPVAAWLSAQKTQPFGSNHVEEQIARNYNYRSYDHPPTVGNLRLDYSLAKESGGGTEDIKKGKKRKAEGEVEDPAQTKKKAQAATKVTKPRYDFEVLLSEWDRITKPKSAFDNSGRRLSEPVGDEMLAAEAGVAAGDYLTSSLPPVEPDEQSEKKGKLSSSIPASSNAESAWKRLIGHSFPPHEVLPVLEEMFASKDEVKTVCNLFGDVAQAFMNVMHEALDLQTLPPRLREKCLAVLCRICGRQGLLPNALQIPICYDRSDTPLYRGGFADVWKGQLQSRHVAVKVLRIYSTTDSAKTTSRFCREVVTWNTLRHPNVLSLIGVTMNKGEFAMASEWMANGNINEFVKVHWEVNRFELLEDAARGLIHIHSQGMIHGDLKGANILIDQNQRARLADFGLLTIVSDPTYFTASTSAAAGGTTRWMSPELLHPEHFGLDHSRPNKESDCYALGMVIYEVLSGQVPFPRCKDYIIIRKVVDGERPARPEGAKEVWFTDDLWKTLSLCWETQARDRPGIEAVLECLKRASTTWKPLPPQVNEGVRNDESDWDLTALQPSKSPQLTPMVRGGQVSQNLGPPYSPSGPRDTGSPGLSRRGGSLPPHPVDSSRRLWFSRDSDSDSDSRPMAVTRRLVTSPPRALLDLSGNTNSIDAQVTQPIHASPVFNSDMSLYEYPPQQASPLYGDPHAHWEDLFAEFNAGEYF